MRTDTLYRIGFGIAIPLAVITIGSFILLITVLSLYSGVPIEEVPEWARWIIYYIR